ncbi:ABC transporter substrate-binding protein [Actinomadura rugatobispora]|uniref:ABC transporter substrate-binding protein n=1 Tax=Actinomadura rugatobispora TaxID=1994 RepID=A0ABW1AEI9_9ACTN|nr:ABC transporter substrate-binding protein [Actinomadura rugatobispora]
MTALTALLLTATAACGGGASTGGQGGDDGKPIRVGVLLSSVGALKSITEGYNEGFEFFKKKNPTILGRPIEYVRLEDGATPATAVPAAQKLIQKEKVDVIVGPYLSGPTSAVLPYFNRAKLININMSALTDAGNAEKYPFTFHNEWWKDAEGKAQLAHACKLGAKTVATIVVNNPLGTETDASIKHNIGSAPCKLQYLGAQQFSAGAPDVTAQATAARSADVVVTGAAAATDFASIIKSLMQVQYKGWIMGNQAIGEDNTLNLLPAEAAKQIIPFGSTPQTQKPLGKDVQGLFDGVRQNLGKDPGGFWGKAYDSMLMIKMSAEGAKSLDSAAMKKWLETNKFCGAWGCFGFTAASHHPFEPKDNLPYQPGTSVGGIAEPWKQPK